MNMVYSLPSQAQLVKDDPRIPIHVFLLPDVSGSMGGPGFTPGDKKIDDAIQALLFWLDVKREHRPLDLVSIIPYEDTSKVLCTGLNVYHDYKMLTKFVEKLKRLLGGGTQLYRGLDAARKIIDCDESGVSHRVLAYSDGHDFYGARAIKIAQSLKSRGVLLETIGLGQAPTDVDEKFLKSVATTDHLGTHYRFIGSADELQETFTKLATGMLTMD